MCVRRNAPYRKLELPKSTRFVVNTVLIVAVSTCGPTGVSPPPLSSQNIQSHEKYPAIRRGRGDTQATSLTLGENREGKERVKGKASWIQSSRIGFALVCVHRNVQHRELQLPKSTRFGRITAVMVALPTSGPTGYLIIVSSPPL